MGQPQSTCHQESMHGRRGFLLRTCPPLFVERIIICPSIVPLSRINDACSINRHGQSIVICIACLDCLGTGPLHSQL
jgi:hypothetical protein